MKLPFSDEQVMARPINVCVIGAGSSYTPELIEGFIDRRDKLNLQSVRFVDIDQRRLDILANMAERMFRYAGMDVPVQRFTDRRRGIDAGATKTFALTVDGDGHVLGFGRGGSGNHASRSRSRS